MYGKVAGGGAAGGISMLPDTGGFLPLGAGLEAIIVFVAAFTLIATGLALWNLAPRRES